MKYQTENTTMTATRKVEIFSAGCPTCQEAIAKVEDLACSSCEVVVLDISMPRLGGLETLERLRAKLDVDEVLWAPNADRSG